MSNPEHTWGRTIDFGEEYYQNALKMLRALRDDAAIIAAVAQRCTDALKSGRKVYVNAVSGHMPRLELVNEREGNPALFEFSPGGFTPEQCAAMGPGDVLITNSVSDDTLEAREAGAYVVVITTCYANNPSTPPGQVRPNTNDWMPADVASQVLESYIPWEQGLVHAPEVPEMAICPGSAIGTCSIHWMLTAEVAHTLATGQTPDGSIGSQYLDLMLQRLEDFHRRDLESANALAVTVAKRIIGGGRFYVRSRNGGVQSEATSVAQGVMLSNAFEPRPAAAGGNKDTFLIAAVSADDPQELAWADAARANGNYIVGIGSTEGNALQQRCDSYFDNRCPEATGTIPLPGRDQSVSPATGIINLIIMYVIKAKFIDEMCRRGAVPYFWMGVYRPLGFDYIDMVRPFFKERGY